MYYEGDDDYIMIKQLQQQENIAGFLRKTAFVDYSTENIRMKADELFNGISDDTEKARIAYEFVRDKIPHSFDIDATVITAKASDVLIHETGICHAKANLLAALLRSQRIPVGFCFQHLTLMDDDSAGYCVHCYNAVFLDGHWVKIDARGNKPGVDAQFSLDARFWLSHAAPNTTNTSGRGFTLPRIWRRCKCLNVQRIFKTSLIISQIL